MSDHLPTHGGPPVQPQTISSPIPEQLGQAQLRNLYANPTYAIFVVDPTGRILTWNYGAARMKQYTADEAIGRNFAMLYPEDARAAGEHLDHLQTAAREGFYRGEGIRVRKSGEHFLADVLITPIYRDGKITGFSKIVADVTEQGKIRDERDESRQEARDLRVQSELREAFVSTLAHDLRNPLAGAKTAIELIMRRPCEQGTHARMCSVALRSLVRLERMITDLLDANRITAGQPVPLRRGRCDLAEIIEKTVNDFRLTHGERFTVQSPGPVWGEWDAFAIRRVIENLLSNAVKYGDDSTPVTLSLRSSPDQAELEVHNFGPPIPLRDQKTLFERFRRTKEADRSASRGWGLGLTLVRGISEAHHGAVTVRSEAGEGTTFTVTLPRSIPVGQA